MRSGRLWATVLATLGAVLTVGTVGLSPAAAIANGKLAVDGQFPFAVKVTMTGIPNSGGSTRDSACSGALVSSTWVMTAGHCFHDVAGRRVSGATPYPTTATLDTADLAADAGQTRNVVEVRQSSKNDIALVRLDQPVTDVSPVSVSTTKPARGEVLTFAGWGATSSVDPHPSTQLYWGQVQVSTIKTTTVLVKGYYPAPDTSACPYDSGAPYLRTPAGRTPVLVSVENDGPNCPHSLQETTARVDVIADWVSSVVTGTP